MKESHIFASYKTNLVGFRLVFQTKNNMAKVGYIFMADAQESFEQDKAWMKEYGCIRIVEEKAENEKLRPEWRTLLMALERGDLCTK